MSIIREDITLLNGSTTGKVVRPQEPSGKPLLVFVHGGGASAFSMDIPGHSLMEAAAINGFTAVAPNRPGYAGSATLGFPGDSEDGLFAANAERLYDAIAEAWTRYGAGAPGVVVYGSSVGGAITLHLASQWSAKTEPAWPLLGVVTADIAQLPAQKAVDAWKTTPVTEYANIAALQPLLDTPPRWTIPAYALDPSAMPGIFEPALRAEIMEVNYGWPQAYPAVAGSITVPVLYRLGQFDNLWTVSEELVTEFATTLRTSSPYVDAAIFGGSSHGLADGPAGYEFFHQVFGFALRAAANVAIPQLLEA
ncbi:MAG TPA: alpha/beta hydrolase [Gryllotalpicola sp.]